MTKPLSPRERQVLYSLVRNPFATDSGLGEDAGLKLSTVTAIRRRLRERGYYSTVRVPCLQRLGAEMLAVVYSRYKATIPLHVRLMTGQRLVESHKEVFWAMSEYSQAMSFQLARNFTDVRRNVTEIEGLYTALGFLDEGGITSIALPFEISEIPFFFDFEPLLRQAFGIAGDGGGAAHGYPTRGKPEAAPLTDVGRRVYRALVEHPEASDTALSKGISVSQRTVTKLREGFEAQRLMKTTVVPDLGKLGFKMLVLDHAKLNLRIRDAQRREILKTLLDIKPPILLAIGGDDVVALTAYEDFEDYRRCMNRFSDVYKQDDIFVREPRRMMFSLAEMRLLKSHSYGQIVGKLLGI